MRNDGKNTENAAAEKAEKLARKKQSDELKRAQKAEREKQKQRLNAEKKKASLERQKVKSELRKSRKAARMAFYGKMRKKLANGRYGFDYKNYGFLPRTELTVRGDATSVATRLSAAGIAVVDLTKNGASVTFKIRKKDLRKAIAILNEMCYNFSVGDTLGAARLGAFCLSRIGLLLGACFVAVFLNIAYSYVWRLEITGNDVLSSAVIKNALAEEGIKSGLKKSEFKPSNVAAAVERIDGVADASAEIKGTTLRINVLESKDFTVHEKYGSYISDYDATVTRIVTRSGTSRVKRGDVVKKGDCLCDGHVYSTAGELLYTSACDAEIYGNISITIDAEISPTEIVYRRTGKKSSKTTFELFGLKLFKAKSPFVSYESTSATAHYDVLIPLYATTVTYYETERAEVERDIDDAVKDYAVKKKEELGLSDGFEFSYTVRESYAGMYGVHLFLSGETLISRGVADVPEPAGNKENNEKA